MRYLKYIRIAAAGAVLFICTVIFFDYYELIPPEMRESVLYIQFIPSVLTFIVKPGFAASGFILIIMLTIFSGRVYCSFFCPLGILQDIAIFTTKKKFVFTNAHNRMRFGILIITAVSMISGGTVLIAWLDPFSIFGRSAGYIISAGAGSLNNLAANTAADQGMYFLHSVKTSNAPWPVIAASTASIAGILITAALRGRLYCNTVCPVGAALALLSRFSIFRISINENTCTKCGACASLCRSACIDTSSAHVDFTRCVACFDCLTVCPVDSIGYISSRNSDSGIKTVPNTGGGNIKSGRISRKKFLAGLLIIPAGRALSQTLNRPAPVYRDISSQTKYMKQVTPVPPGGRSTESFNSACTACSLCISICPTGVLQPSVLQHGLRGMMQPYMDYESGYCSYDCTLCGQVCPTGAIRELEIKEKRTTRIGKATFIKENCITYTNGTVCGACSEHCPTKAVHMIPYKGRLVIPEVNNDLCIGCGACENVCPVRPYRAIFVDGIRNHEKSEKPESEKNQIKQTEDFPF